MSKRVILPAFAVIALGLGLWFAMKDQPSTARTGIPATENKETKGPRSRRHESGEIQKDLKEKSRLTSLEVSIREQEAKVQQGREVLLGLVRARNVILRGNETSPEDPKPAETPDPSGAATDNDAQAFADARKAYQTDKALLEELKLKLTEEKAGSEK